MLFFVFDMAMVSLAFMLSTIVTTTTSAYGVSFLFLLIAVVLQVVLSNISMVYFIFYPEHMTIWVPFPLR